MKYIAIALIAILPSCQHVDVSGKKDVAPQLGEKISLPSNAEHQMISSAQISPSTTLKRGEISYTVAVNDSNRIIYISTSSPSFRTPEGLGADSTLEHVLAAGGSPVVYETGWAYISKLPSGWCAAFYGASSDGTRIDLFKVPTSSTKVDHYFKRR